MTLPKIKKKNADNQMQRAKSSPASQTHTHCVFFSRTRFEGYELLKTTILKQTTKQMTTFERLPYLLLQCLYTIEERIKGNKHFLICNCKNFLWFLFLFFLVKLYYIVIWFIIRL
jgi:hypothetical protein